MLQEITKLQNQLDQQKQELKNIKNSLSNAQGDVSMLTTKLSDLRQQKNHLEHEKDEEIGTINIELVGMHHLLLVCVC